MTAGYPNKEDTVELILGFEKAGADIIELGMPFSDPLADGPTIQYSSDVAIANGVDLESIFEMVKELRKQSQIPLVLMGYINPVFHYGLDRFIKRCAAVGVDGLILPDVPVEEDKQVRKLCFENGVSLIYLVAPNTSEKRLQLTNEKTSSFVYCVSVTGVTGARDAESVQKSVNTFIDRVRKNIDSPILVGFGIKSHQDALLIAEKADGFIVGSALIEHIRAHQSTSNWKEELFSFVRELKTGSKK